MLKQIIFLIVLMQCASYTSVHANEPPAPAPAVEIGEVKSNGVRHVNANEASRILEENSDIVVLDVRTGIEFNRGRIDGAMNINYYSFSFKKKIAALDRSKTYLVHCATGVRSGKSIPIMLEAGFTSLIHMDGGFKSWKASELPFLK